MPLVLHYQNEHNQPGPDRELIFRWVVATLNTGGRPGSAELTVRIVDEFEMQDLNGRFRGKHRPTNVLAFCADLPPELQLPLLGDMVICAAVVTREATEQAKQLQAHWAHITIHGTLHLLGFDHCSDSETREMESTETAILAGLSYPAPY